MLEFGDSIYYIDLKAFDNVLTINKGSDGKTTRDQEMKIVYDGGGNIVSTETYERISPQHKEIDAAKYDLLKTFIEYIIDYEDESDDTLGAERALNSTPLGYKIVFNTLYKEGIIKEKK
jgi:hypothetical protein